MGINKDKLFSPAPGNFSVKSKFQPAGDQPAAIEQCCEFLKQGEQYQTILGVTGSGKTYTIANIVAELNRPALVIAPNKTLAAQLYNEFKEFFPANKVRYFVSYYDYYQPEAYLPNTDTYIEKDSAVNQEIDKLRHSATRAILETRDTIVVASVSCIYGLGAPEDYFNLMLYLEIGDEVEIETVLEQLVYMQYQRSDLDFQRGRFRVRGDQLDIFPGDHDGIAYRIEFFSDEIEELSIFDPVTGKTISKVSRIAVYPLSHFVTDSVKLKQGMKRIYEELKERIVQLRQNGKGFEAQRLEQRTMYDLELMREIGFCYGIENYSRHLAGREAGEPPTTLIDYFTDDFITFIDESHVTVSQIGGMYNGDQARKRSLVDYGFRLPSALDNRPLSLDEFWKKCPQVVFVSATPGDKEKDLSKNKIVEMVNRPTGLLDPQVEVRPATNQIDDLVKEIHETVAKDERVIVTTLTKKMAEDISVYFQEIGIRAKYLHSEINTIERVELIRGLRKGDFDVIIGINLLREGLDLIEVSLVAILDADKEGFLRSTRSLIQMIGRASRNLNGRVVMYADRKTKSIQEAIAETNRRREIQVKFNQENNITPKSVSRAVDASIEEKVAELIDLEDFDTSQIPEDIKELTKLIAEVRDKMSAASNAEDYELAGKYRDFMYKLQEGLIA